MDRANREMATMIRKTLLLIACLTTSAVIALDGEEELPKGGEGTSENEPIEILRRVDAATKAVKSVKYTGSFKGTGWLAERVAQVEGTAIIGDINDENPQATRYDQFRFDVRVTENGSDEVKRFTAGNAGQTFYLINWAKQMVHVGSIPDVLGTDGRTSQAIAMVEFVHPTPFSDEINGDEAVLTGTTMIGDELCYVIDVTYRGAISESTWYFSQRDFLPRRVDRIYNRRGDRATTELIVTDLVVDPEIDVETLALVVPEGFEKTNKLPPNRAARAVRRVFDY